MCQENIIIFWLAQCTRLVWLMLTIQYENVLLQLRNECDNGRDLEKMQSLLPSYLKELESSCLIFIPVHNPRFDVINGYEKERE